MTTLIERLETAEGPSRELDAELHVAVFPRRPSSRTMGDIDNHYMRSIPSPDDSCAAGTFWENDGFGKSLHTAPNYTASIDCALALVPDGDRDLHFTRTSRGDERHKLWDIRIAIDEVKDDPDEAGGLYGGWHDHPAIALCIAALKARQALKGE